MSVDEGPVIRRFIGVYNAEGTLRGELAYWFGKRLGTAHCGLCDITHGRIRERSEWKQCRDALPVPFDTFHLDDQPAEVRALTVDHAPAVIADTATGLLLLLGPEELDDCDSSSSRLVERLMAAVAAQGLSWPSD